MMTKKSMKGRPQVKTSHLKYVGIQNKTLERYEESTRRFFKWLKTNRLPMPNDLNKLDELAGDFVNVLYLDDRPMHWAVDFVCGIKRLYPKCSKVLHITSSYIKNWQRTTRRKRAIPLKKEIILALAAIAILKKKPRFGLILLLGFNGLLRADEMLQLTFGQISILKPDTLVITFEESKGAKRRNEVESVMIKEASIVPVVSRIKQGCEDEMRVYEGTYKEFSGDLTALAAQIGLKNDRLTTHGIRRGGATWFFSETASYDRTQEQGRWECSKTAKTYINGAMAEMGAATIPEWGQKRLTKAVNCLDNLLQRVV